MLRVLIIFAPFMVCLFWLIVFVLRYGSYNPAKKVLTWFLLTCTVLYLCHALYFAKGPNHVAESIWAFCSLSVYPLYYLYIKALTTNVSNNRRQFRILVPGLVVALAIFFFPGKFSDYARIILFTVQVVFVFVSGFGMLRSFDKLVASCYADIEGRETGNVKKLLIAFFLTTVLSACVNIIGKQFFFNEDKPLLVVAMLFAAMLFALSYIGYARNFSFVELSDETGDAVQELSSEPADGCGERFERIMNEEKLYLTKGLTINDVASQVGLCRSYVSHYINQSKGESFSDYINRMRIEHAKTVLASEREIKNVVLAEMLGFANEQGFYRNFKKFTGLTPVEWKKRNKNLPAGE